LRPADYAVGVFRSRRLTAEETRSTLGAVTGGVVAHVGEDGLVIISDRSEVLRRVAEMIALVDAQETVTWAVQLYVVSLSSGELRDLGLDVVPSVNVAAALAGSSGGFATALEGTSAAARLDLTLRAIGNGDVGSLVADPLLLLTDGREASLSRGERFLFRTVSTRTQDGSTLTQQEVQTLQTGVIVRVSVREIGMSRARLRLNVDLADLQGFRDDLPQVSNQVIDTEADVASGGVYLVGALERNSSSRSYGQWLHIGERRERTRGVLQVWAKVYRISGKGAKDGPQTANRVEHDKGSVLRGMWSPARGSQAEGVLLRVDVPQSGPSQAGGFTAAPSVDVVEGVEVAPAVEAGPGGSAGS
ncbi:MAG: hypothetical protein SFV23_11760, partial [Planctomycetaceae bacterium]|nr:hypothetical protein [Planctomycetaceae bacterium]